MDAHLSIRLRIGLFVVSVAAVGVTACTSSMGLDDLQQGFIVDDDKFDHRHPFGHHGSRDIVGTWQRTIAFIDEFGMLNRTVTTWTFESAGGALRQEIIANVTLGIADTVLTTGEWRADSAFVFITFRQPTPSQLRIDALVQGNLLFLGGQEFRRVECCATPR